ncbi:hypothetical protein SO694_00055222 [Aureococcus anophagefferens]|uniref:Uncharacterized protein n=1 Tax=Aureococcus anophagefferens TaxID=44056 RepID=A0ABR1FXJ2_AURAN
MGKQRKRQRVDAGPKGPVGTSTPLHAACRGDDAGAVAAILADLQAKKLAAAVDARDEHGRTPLHLACWAAAATPRRSCWTPALALAPGAGRHDGAPLREPGRLRRRRGAPRRRGRALDAECTKSLKTPPTLRLPKATRPPPPGLAAGADGAKKTRKGETALDLATSDDAKAAFATEPSAKPRQRRRRRRPEVAAPVVAVAPEVVAAQEVATPPAAASPAPVAAPPAPPAEDASAASATATTSTTRTTTRSCRV